MRHPCSSMSDQVLRIQASTLASPCREMRLVSEIYRHVRRGGRVVSLVPARADAARLVQTLSLSGIPAVAVERPVPPHASGVSDFGVGPFEGGFDALQGPRLEGQVWVAAVGPDLINRGITVDDTAANEFPIQVPRRPLRVLLLGLGTVGRGVYDLLQSQSDRFRIAGILVRSPRRHIESGVPVPLLHSCKSDIEGLLEDSQDLVVVETLGGIDPARPLIERALHADRPVVTANKELVSAGWDSLSRFRTAMTGRLHFSAAVGGAVPMIELVDRLRRQGTHIRDIRGVVNGTCNFILEQLAAGVPFDAAVGEAQARGFAEPDPSADLNGRDAARKLDILSRLAFAKSPRRWNVRGLDANSLRGRGGDGVGRLIARVDGGGTAHVGVEMLSPTDFLAGACGAENRLEVTTVSGEIHRLSGLGAGRRPTAVAIMGDLLEVYSKHAGVVQEPPASFQVARGSR